MRRALLFLSIFSCLFSQAQTTRYYQVILRSDVGTTTLWDGVITPIYGFTPLLSQQPTLPGYTIYAEEGDTVIITARSVSQGAHHTIHLHGLDVDTRNDGDPATSFYLEHMQDTDYTFIATYAGTYIYHCHVEDVVHVQMGMYGSVIVSSANGVNTAWTGGPAFDKEYNWLVTELDTVWHNDPPQHDITTDTFSIIPYNPQYYLINGLSETQLPLNDETHIQGAVGEKIYLRLTNIMYTDHRYIFPSSLNAEIIDSDGRPLPNSITSDTLIISPGERYGVMLSPTTEFTGSISVDFINMNTFQVLNTQYPPVTIEGYFGVEERSDNGFGVYPNPAASSIRIQLPGKGGEYNIQVFSVSGQEIYSGKGVADQQGQMVFDISKIQRGICFIQVSDEHNLYSERILIMR
jgi:hypothetical protein